MAELCFLHDWQFSIFQLGHLSSMTLILLNLELYVGNKGKLLETPPFSS